MLALIGLLENFFNRQLKKYLNQTVVMLQK